MAASTPFHPVSCEGDHNGSTQVSSLPDSAPHSIIAGAFSHDAHTAMTSIPSNNL